MGAEQGTTLNTELGTSVKTSAEHADDGTGTSRWLLWVRSALLDSVVKVVDAAAGASDRGLNVLAVRRDTATGEGATGDYVRLTTDALSRLRTVPSKALTNATSTALEETRVIKASAGVLYGVSGHANIAGYVLIGNKATALNGTSDAVFSLIKVAEGPFSIDYGVFGRQCSTGISIGFSSSTTWVAGGSHIWVDAQYE